MPRQYTIHPRGPARAASVAEARAYACAASAQVPAGRASVEAPVEASRAAVERSLALLAATEPLCRNPAAASHPARGASPR